MSPASVDCRTPSPCNPRSIPVAAGAHGGLRGPDATLRRDACERRHTDAPAGARLTPPSPSVTPRHASNLRQGLATSHGSTPYFTGATRTRLIITAPPSWRVRAAYSLHIRHMPAARLPAGADLQPEHGRRGQRLRQRLGRLPHVHDEPDRRRLRPGPRRRFGTLHGLNNRTSSHLRRRLRRPVVSDPSFSNLRRRTVLTRSRFVSGTCWTNG